MLMSAAFIHLLSAGLSLRIQSNKSILRLSVNCFVDSFTNQCKTGKTLPHSVKAKSDILTFFAPQKKNKC